MKYAGFWARLGALFIDGIVQCPLSLSLVYVTFSSNTLFVLTRLFTLVFTYILYNTWFQGKFQSTIGKMVVGIKVVSVNGERATYRQFIYRNSVPFILLLINLILSPDKPGMNDISSLAAGGLVMMLFMLWSVAEVVILLCNKEKRAIHDYMAGTVVVYKDSIEQAVDFTQQAQ